MLIGYARVSTDRQDPPPNAACRAGDTLVVTELDRLARSLPAARAIADEFATGQVRLNLGGSVHNPTDRAGQRGWPPRALSAGASRGRGQRTSATRSS